MMISTRLALVCTLVLSYSVYAGEKTVPDKRLTYKNIGETELELHVFSPENHKASDRRPAIVFFFGGGWSGGSPSQFYPHCKYLASRGMVAMSPR
jgi:acetyl esterase